MHARLHYPKMWPVKLRFSRYALGNQTSNSPLRILMHASTTSSERIYKAMVPGDHGRGQ